MCMILFESGEFCAFYGVVRYTLQWVQKLSSQLPVAGTARFLQGARIDGFLGGYWHPNTVSGATSLVGGAAILLHITAAEAEELQEHEDEDEWDEWLEDEDKDDDADELRDAGVRVQLTKLLDEFLGENNQHKGHVWKQEAPTEGDADQGPQRFHPAPLVVTAATPTDTVSIRNLQNTRNADQLYDLLISFLRRETGLGFPELRTQIQLTTKVNSWSRARLFHAPPPFKPSEGSHIEVIRAQPMKADRYDRVSRPARFDTVLVWAKEKLTNGIHSY
ncbi:hypothetical protein RhiJN_07295 [Ceratobasidium sp. AG-Ba]|nr:hypothetical protein RhiJN_07295 [Ceratobasidium sp. AG-Ba]